MFRSLSTANPPYIASSDGLFERSLPRYQVHEHAKERAVLGDGETTHGVHGRASVRGQARGRPDQPPRLQAATIADVTGLVQDAHHRHRQVRGRLLQAAQRPG